MEVVTVAEKLHDLETWLIESLGQDSARARLTSVRKAAEALCKVILLNHCGHETGSRVIQGHEELDGSPGQGQPRSLSDLVQLVCKSGAQITPPIPDSIARRQVYTRLEMVRTHTNPASHDPDNSTNSTPDSPDEVIGIVLPPLALTVNWMYRFIQRTLPPEIQEILKPLLPDSPTGLESFEDLRGIDVVRLYYPNQRIVSHRSQSDWKEKVSYEYVAVEVARQNVVGFLFLKRHITIHKSLAHFASSLDHDLANIFICSPNVVSRDTGREVDRLKSIQEQYASLGSSKLPEKPELYYIRDFLWQYCLSKHASELTLPFTSAEPFVDQELYRIDSSDAPHPLDCDSLEHSTQLINATEAEEPVVLIAGPAGVGKSTFCEHLAQRINSLDKKRAILISSTDLRDAMPDSPITSVSELYMLYTRLTDTVQSNILAPENLELNISCGNLVLIIDGLDEIESILKEKFGVDSFLDSAIALNTIYNRCAIFITFRDYYLERFHKRLDVATYSLLGFNEESVTKYLSKRFADNHVKRARVNNLLKLLGRFRADAQSYLMPLYLTLICNIVEREQEGEESDLPDVMGSRYFLASMPTDVLIHNLLRREIRKQSIRATCDEYFDLLREIVLSHKGRISKIHLNEYIEVCFRAEPTSRHQSERYRQFYVSPLLTYDSRGGLFTIRYHYIETWIKARVIAQHFRAMSEGDNRTAMQELKPLLAELYYGRGELFDELVELKQSSDAFSLENARIVLGELISCLRNSPPVKEEIELRRALSGLLYLVLGVKHESDKRQFTEKLVELYGGRKWDYLTVFGPFFPVDFTNIRVEHGWFEGFTQFSKCSFPRTGTVFFTSTFREVDPGQAKQTTPSLFDDSCTLSEALQVFVARNSESIEVVRERISADLIKVLKVGFRRGNFQWKSESVYKKVTLQTDIRLARFLNFLVERGVLVEEKVLGSSAGVGYYVAQSFRGSAKDAIVNAIETAQLANVIHAALAEFHRMDSGRA